MNNISKVLTRLDSFNKLIETIKNKENNIIVQGTLESQKEHLIYAVQSTINNKSIVITNTEDKAKEIYNNLQFFYKDKVLLYPEKDILFYSADVRSMDIMKQRSVVYEAIINNDDVVVILSVSALLDRLSPKSSLKNFYLDIFVGQELSIDDFVDRLVSMGYKRSQALDGNGQFCKRGGILDVFPPTMETGIRVEYFGDEIDSIRILDEHNNRSIEKIDKAKITPVRELVYSDEAMKKAIHKLEADYKLAIDYFEKNDDREKVDNVKHSFGHIIDEVKEFGTSRNMDILLPYVYDEKVSLLDYLSDDYIIYFDEVNRVIETAKFKEEEFKQAFKNRLEKGYMLKTCVQLTNSFNDIVKKSKSYTHILLSGVMTATKLDKSIQYETVNMPVSYVNINQGDIELFKKEIIRYYKEQYKVIVLSGSKTRGTILVKELMEVGVPSNFVDSMEDDITEGIFITRGSLNRSFVYDELKIVVLSDKEIFETNKRKKRKNFKNGEKIKSYTDLKVGDYVVHTNHGIGVFKGVEKIRSAGVTKDYIKVGFADNGNIYVATNQLDIIQKYIGGESKNVKLNKLGSKEWSKTKVKTQKAIQVMAKELLELYAKREATKGYQYGQDTTWQKEFEDMFPYNETEDQLTAIQNVKDDMEHTKVMDRLVCGDVGYGKTEVAIRATFKAIQDNKQVAYLCPTTILAGQHYNTFKQRMKDFPIGIELLSRFRTKKQQEESLERIRKGKSEILIGTHRILSKDVEFKDLGLVIIDEEQRFGVKHKEKLKMLRENVDVLTLTATPIPRTLHMSMTGIRDMSVLSEPPRERIPVQTYVLEYNEELISEAIRRELGRGGQVFFLHNRVRTIDAVAEKIQKLVPEANVSMAHGQMSERQLENIMNDFINNESNILVCTTIIETGIDISNANTIIINDADSMGLSQLYQLRGRVGRSNRTAYTYLLYKRNKVLTEVAEKRLQTLRDYTEFGSGFKIAMRDLEIRGAGSLLGEQQSGHLETVGYEMYCTLLDEEIRRLKGEVIEEKVETLVDLEVSAFISSEYVSNEIQKIELYKKIATIQTEEDKYDVEDELIDKYGDIPTEVYRLLDIALLKAYCNNMRIESVVQKGDIINITCDPLAKISMEKYEVENKKHRGALKLIFKQKPILTYKIPKNINKVTYDVIQTIMDILQSIEQ